MPDYLPLSAFRQGLLPAPCRSCTWWQSVGSQRYSNRTATDKRRLWMAGVEATWGTSGLLLETGGGAAGAAPVIAASINFAPVTALPRLHELPVGPLPEEATLLFCLTVADDQPHSQAKRVVQKALGHLKTRGVEEAYALARSIGDPDDPSACRFFPVDLLAANGFQEVMEHGGLVLMRVDLRGLLALVDRLETAVTRLLHNEPAPSPAAWTQRGT
jgi:hypothetical protein